MLASINAKIGPYHTSTNPMDKLNLTIQMARMRAPIGASDTLGRLLLEARVGFIT